MKRKTYQKINLSITYSIEEISRKVLQQLTDYLAVE